MESSEYIFNTYNSSDTDELSSQTPVGWSSICLDQTISYYIDHNSILKEGIDNNEKERIDH